MSIEAIKHYEAALREAFPRGATGDVFEHWNKARIAIAEAGKQEPVALQMDVIVVNLVREGINKHRARELAEHFIKHTHPQPKREPLTDEDKAILEAVRRELDEGDGNAPGHGHRVVGIWDEDNGDKAGKPCAWCLTWAKFTKLIENEAAHGITNDMKQEPVAKTAKQRHEEST